MDPINEARLKWLAEAKPGEMWNEELFPTGAWHSPLSDTAKAALAEIERLRDILRCCVRGPDIADLGNGEIIALHLPHKGGAGLSNLKQEIKRG